MLHSYKYCLPKANGSVPSLVKSTRTLITSSYDRNGQNAKGAIKHECLRSEFRTANTLVIRPRHVVSTTLRPATTYRTTASRPRYATDKWTIKTTPNNNHSLRTLYKILEHPPNLNVHWLDAEHMITALGGKIDHSNGRSFKVFFDDTMMGICHTGHACLDREALHNLRNILERADIITHAEHRESDDIQISRKSNTPDQENVWHSDGKHVICLVSHHSASIYTTETKHSAPAVTIRPNNPREMYYRESKDRAKQEYSLHQSEPEQQDVVDKEYFRAIVDAVKDAEEIVLAGITTTVKNNAMDFLIDTLRRNNDLSKVVGTLYVDNHVTEAQMLASARELYNKLHA